MDKSVEAKIAEVIRSALPAEVGDLLKKELEAGKIAQTELERAGNRIYELEKHVKSRDEQIEKLKAQVKAEEVLNKRQVELEARELRLELEMMKIKLGAAESANNKIINFIDALMRNTKFRENVFNQTGQSYMSNGQMGQTYETGKTIDKIAE